MASRYALYIRSRWQRDHNPCYYFSASFPSLEAAREKLEWCKKNTPYVEAILLESEGVNSRIDPYHKDFLQNETA